MKDGGNGRGGAEDRFMSSALFFTGVVISSLGWMLTPYCTGKMSTGAVWYGKIDTFNVLQSQIMARFQCFQAYKLMFLWASLDCLHVCENSWRKVCWYAGRYWHTKARGSALSLLCWRHEVQNCQKYLTSIYERSLRRTKRGERLRWGKKGGYR